ncbi:unnamed protein product [Prorocentrum cordatum]|uniref:General transcription factor IIH subunit 4 n=1 Tax=Prorocentrum cordatum TaxID=2364126 RepID=A0ABN9VZU4_9DINO|nr:unnamed protein product [Polarella glacialis]
MQHCLPSASLLGVFCKISTQLPNLVVGQLSAETALRAMKRGIRAENIVRYLDSAAHPRARERREDGGLAVPGNVRSQLEVWESSRSRSRAEGGRVRVGRRRVGGGGVRAGARPRRGARRPAVGLARR